MKNVNYMGDDTIMVALDDGEKMPMTSPVTVSGVSYDVADIVMPDNGVSSNNIVFLLKYKPTKQGK